MLEEADRCDRLALLHQGNIVARAARPSCAPRIGGDVVVLETSDAASLASGIESRFGVEAGVPPMAACA